MFVKLRASADDPIIVNTDNIMYIDIQARKICMCDGRNLAYINSKDFDRLAKLLEANLTELPPEE